MGKTTLLFYLLEKFRHSARTVFLFQTQCNSREFLRFLLSELGIETQSQDFVKMQEEFNNLLLQEARAGRRFIVVIDEAQNLDASVMETVRLLSDFETPQAKLLQIVMSGQPELADKLAARNLVQLRQRVSLIGRLTPLTIDETREYIEYRLGVAGHSGPSPFTAEALPVIADFTEGIPRNINNFCFCALSLACALGQKVVDLALVEEVIRDLNLNQFATEGLGLAPGNEPSARTGAGRGLPPSYDMPYIAGSDPRVNLSPAEARAYMQQLTMQFKDLKRN
jgi:type II secretory pathway predicted ATPase ExeA